MCTADQSALPGLDHLRTYVDDWQSAVRVLSLTAAAIAESVSAGATSLKQPSAPVEKNGQCNEGASAVTPMELNPPSPRPAPTLVLPAPALKPGRVFVVANISGAYYSLLDLLSAHKFDFRVDNLLHVGNLVAPPMAAAPPPYGASGSASVVSDPRVARNSPSVLRLVRRHSARGPMGSHECLALLAAAAANRARGAEEERRRAALAAQRSAAAGTSALSMQLAAAVAATAGTAPAPVPAANSYGGRHPAVPIKACQGARRGSESSSDSGSDSDSDSDSDSEACSVQAPPTPHRSEDRNAAASASASASSAASSWRSVSPAPATTPSSSGGGAGFGGGGAGGSAGFGSSCPRAALDNLDLVHLLGLPARVVLEPYGIVLQHAGPAAAAVEAEPSPRHHVVFSHRRAAASSAAAPASPTAASAAAADAALQTGLACPRPVLRCAVLPPLRSLHRSSPGFLSKLAAGRAPSRAELLLEVVEAPLSDLDFGAPPPPPASLPAATMATGAKAAPVPALVGSPLQRAVC